MSPRLAGGDLGRGIFSKTCRRPAPLLWWQRLQAGLASTSPLPSSALLTSPLHLLTFPPHLQIMRASARALDFLHTPAEGKGVVLENVVYPVKDDAQAQIAAGGRGFGAALGASEHSGGLLNNNG